MVGKRGGEEKGEEGREEEEDVREVRLQEKRGRKDICVRRETVILEGEVEDKRWASRLRLGGVGRNSVE